MTSKFQMCCELLKVMRLMMSPEEFQLIQALYPVERRVNHDLDALAKKMGVSRRQLQAHAEQLLKQIGTQAGPRTLLARYNNNNDNPAVAVSWQSQLKRAKIARGEMAYDE